VTGSAAEGSPLADVLIVDDDPDAAEALADLMRVDGHEVSIGFNGEEGLRLARERLPDVALLDVEMPVLGGPAMAHQMFIHDMGLENVPVVLLSGVPNLKRVAAEVGTPYFLAKPYRYAQLVALVTRVLVERIAPDHAARLKRE
jgi:DNA-binding response OmpR family regulator